MNPAQRVALNYLPFLVAAQQKFYLPRSGPLPT